MPDFEELKDRLPLSESSFVNLRSTGSVYVDKSEYVYRLARNRQPRILTRPRRFGKSTLLSTVEELFLHGVESYDGQVSCFKGLAIEKLWKDPKKYPVLHLNFYSLNDECRTVAEFRKNLCENLDAFAARHGVTLPQTADKPSKKLKALAGALQNNSLVLLIDEYDAPLLSHIGNREEEEEALLIIRAMFSTVKEYSLKFRCVFFTGITRYQDLGLGTAGNSFTDISMDSSFAACCGYTREELKVCFRDHLRYSAAVRLGIRDEEVTEEQTEAFLDEMSSWYDGYSFDGKPGSHVFSTWSVLRFFGDEEARLTPYWSTEEGLGLPKLLKTLLKRIDVPKLLEDLSRGSLCISDRQFIQSSLINPGANPYSLLFQTGYLTLKEPYTKGSPVHLECPNTEISMAFANLMALRIFREDEEDLYTEPYANKTLEVLTSLDPEKLRSYLNDLFAALPYENYPVSNEAAVAALIAFNLRGAGLKPRPEVLSSTGRADTILDLPEHKLTIVFEYKYEESSKPERLDARLEEAVKQIRKRRYGLSADRQSRLARFALVFCAAPDMRSIERVKLVDIIGR